MIRVTPATAQELKELRSEHFIVRYPSDIDEDVARSLKSLGEDYYRRISQEFNLIRDKLWVWDNRAKIYVARDKAEYVKRYNCPEWSAACVNAGDKAIYTYPHQRNFPSIMAHELTHIIFREYVGQGRLPLWLDESIAVYMEDKLNGGVKVHLSKIRAAIENNTYIPFSQLGQVAGLNGAKQDYIDLFYVESFSIMSFLLDRFGRSNFSQFLFALRNGSTLDAALAKGFVSIHNTAELEQQWKRFYQE